MKRGKGGYYRNLSWVTIVGCASKKSLLRTNSQKAGIGEMLSSKLPTIVEEDEISLYDRVDEIRYKEPIMTKISTKGSDLIRSRSIFKKSRLLVNTHNLCIKGSYLNFLAGFVAKGSLNGLPRY